MKRIGKILIGVPLYVLLLLAGFFGGYAVGKYCDPWNEIKEWICR